jgi:hypothetical protein
MDELADGILEKPTYGSEEASQEDHGEADHEDIGAALWPR